MLRLIFPNYKLKVRLRGPSKAWADKISLADPPPPDAEAYFAPKRTVKHFTDEFFEWKARLISHGDLDEHGKSKVTNDSAVLRPCRKARYRVKFPRYRQYQERIFYKYGWIFSSYTNMDSTLRELFL